MTKDYFTEERSWREIKDSCGIESESTIKAIARENFEFFLEHVLGANTDSDLIQELISLVQDPPTGGDQDSAVKIAIEAARGHSKTFTATEARALWTCYRGFYRSPDGVKHRGVEILIVSATNSQSKDIINDLERMITRNDALSHLKPTPGYFDEYGGDARIDRDEGQWAAQSFTTTTDVRVRSKTYSSGIRGKHVDMLLMDDILTTDGSRTIQKEKDLFYEDFSPIIENKNGLLQVVGTPRAHNGLLEELMDKDSFYTAKYPAVKANGEPLWPYKWSKEGLEEKKAEIGPARFAREYLCKPISKGEKFFPYDRAIEPNIDDAHRHFRNIHDGSSGQYEDWSFYAGFDIAMADGSGSDYAVFTVIGLDPDGHAHVVDQRRRQGMGPEQIVDLIVELDDRYGFARAYSEKNAIGFGVWKEIEKRDQLRGRVEEFNTTRKNRQKILSDLQAALYRNAISIPNEDNLIDELLGFSLRNGKLQGREHDDTVMALAIGWQSVDDASASEVSATIVSESGDDDEIPGLIDDDTWSDKEEYADQAADMGIIIP